ncbi:MAG: nucleotidyltransferase family protein [Desulfomonile tiedjei]|nr:nucleotidyltransferase family protein [Desulfomonile tiedjei]
MTREEALPILTAHRDEIGRLSVKSVALFGSVARDEAVPGSDIDILVEFSAPVGLLEFIRLKRFLEELFQCPVDLATPDALKDHVRERILREAVRAA